MNEEKNGYMRMDDRDMMEINAVAEAWTRSIPMETVYEIAKRFHFHFTAQIFMNDRAEFNLMKKAYKIEEEDINRLPHKTNDYTSSILDKLDEIVGFKRMTDKEMEEQEEQEGENPLPDAGFFKTLGLN